MGSFILLYDERKDRVMVETILKFVLGIDAILFIVLCVLSCSPDFLNWCARKADPEWAKKYDKNLSNFLNLKNESGAKEWGR